MLIKDKKMVRKVFYKVQKAIKEQEKSLRMIYIGTSKWGNAIVRNEQTVTGLYILGFESSWKPILITSINLTGNDTNTTYQMNNNYTHTNINTDIAEKQTLLTIDGKAYKVTIYGQEFCNPLTADHVFMQDEEEVRGLIRANLMSQNFNDPFCTPRQVMNDEIDVVLDKNMTRENHSVIEMLSGYLAYEINGMGQEEQNNIAKRILDIDKKEVWAKYKNDNCYIKTTLHEYRRNREFYSDYYPAFDYNYIQTLELEIPKEKYDIGVFGVGSAGTAILDQLCRSNWIKDIYLCDFDHVEEKNLINQWYINNCLAESKVSASAYIIGTLKRTDEKIKAIFNVKTDNAKFEDTKYKERMFKYVVSGFDSIKARKNLFNEIKNGNLETQYLIDCRYLDLASSVYVIDTSNKEEMNFYEQNLLADEELLAKKINEQKMSEEEFKKWINDTKICSTCSSIQAKFFKEQKDEINHKCSNRCGGCWDDGCIKEYYNAYLASMPNKAIHSGNTCIKLNYIDIYKYVGAIVFGAIRKIEDNQQKPFTLLEAQTDVKGLPNYMVVKE